MIEAGGRVMQRVTLTSNATRRLQRCTRGNFAPI